MDLQSLSNLFATTYNPDPNVRKAAELQIRKVSFWRSGPFGLLNHQISVTNSRETLKRQSLFISVIPSDKRTYSYDASIDWKGGGYDLLSLADHRNRHN
jgi:hypothetical protein